MDYTKLLEPFILRFNHLGTEYEVEVTYGKASCENFFDVNVRKPLGEKPFQLKERLIRAPAPEHMLWTDENEKLAVIYQRIGAEIEEHLRTKLGIVLLDASSNDRKDDQVNQ